MYTQCRFRKNPEPRPMLVVLAEVKGKDRSIRARKGGEENLEPGHKFKLLPPEATAPGRRHPYKERGCTHGILGPCSTSTRQGRG